MSKMRKEYDPNKVKQRKRKPIVYIICEGKETETLYFKHFRSRNCLVDIIPISSKHKAAEHLVKHAKATWRTMEKVWMFLKNYRNTSQKLFSTQKNEWRD